MTGNDLKIKIKELGITQEVAAGKLGITRATLSNWCKSAYLSPMVIENVKTSLGIECENDSVDANMLDTIRSQQRTIEDLTSIIKTLTNK